MTEAELEASQVRDQTHRLIDTLGGAGLPDHSIIIGMHLALVERILLSGGATKAEQFLRDQATQVQTWGPQFIEAARR
jgi:hypothetical protein